MKYIQADIQTSPSFTSLTEARESLLELVLAQFGFIENAAERHVYTDRLQRWSRKFEIFVKSKTLHGPLPGADRRTVALLELHRLEIEINLKNFLVEKAGRDLMLWDDFMEEYVKMLDLAVIAAGLDDEGTVIQQPHFHMECGISLPVCAVAGRCRDPVLRRKALSILQAMSKQEGIWSSALTAQIGRRVVEMEEEGRDVKSCKDIPVEARLLALRVHIGASDKKATICYIFAQERREEIFEWH